MNFGDRLKRLREQKGISQKQLSEIVGISQTVISSYECNKSKPKFEHIVPIATALQVPLNLLFGVDSLNDDDWIMRFLYSTRDRLNNSSNLYERHTASPFDFVIKEIKKEQNRIESLKKH